MFARTLNRIRPGLYEAILPCTVVADRSDDLAFQVMAEPAGRILTPELTAMAGATPLWTLNVADFRDIPGLVVARPGR